PREEELSEFGIGDVVKIWGVCQHEVDGCILEKGQIPGGAAVNMRRVCGINSGNRLKPAIKKRLLWTPGIRRCPYQLPDSVREGTSTRAIHPRINLNGTRYMTECTDAEERREPAPARCVAC